MLVPFHYIGTTVRIGNFVKIASTEPSMNARSSVIVIDIRKFSNNSNSGAITVVVPVLTYN